MKEHWENICKTKKADQVSWFQSHLSKSLDLILRTGISSEARIIDVGGGASMLVDDLLNNDYINISVLDVSTSALEVFKKRLGSTFQLAESIKEIHKTLFNTEQEFMYFWFKKTEE